MHLDVRLPIVSALVLCAVVTVAASETLPELARRFAPKPVFLAGTNELITVEVDSLVSRADLIVQGRVTATKTYLSDDQKSLLTDYR